MFPLPHLPREEDDVVWRLVVLFLSELIDIARRLSVREITSVSPSSTVDS